MNIRILRRRGLGNGSTLGIKQFSKHNIEIIRNDKVIPQDTDLLIRWGTSSQFPAKKTLNKATAIKEVANKATSREKLQESGVNIPQLYKDLNQVMNFPVILRPQYHSQGKKLWICNNHQELMQNIYKHFDIVKDDFYISEYIQKDKEYGVFIFDNRITSVIEKVAKTDDAKQAIAWNVFQGGYKFQNVKWNDWPIEVIKEALDAWKCFDLTFGRIDIMVKDGKPYILELNSAHSLTSDYRKEVFAKCLDYYIDNGAVKNELNLDNVKSYKSIIHPVLRENKLGTNL